MADYERLLISKLASTGKIQTALSMGIREDHFTSETHGVIFSFMASHLRKYNQGPSLVTLRDEFSDHNFELVNEAFEFLVEQFVIEVKRRRAIDAARDLAVALDDPVQVAQIDQLFLQKARELAQIVPSASLQKFSDMDQRILEYETMEGVTGITMGIPDFDDLTQGIQPHEFVCIAGWQGTGKSTLAQWMLFNAWKQNKRPMYISLEMEARALFRKWDTMAMNFEYAKLKKHGLSDAEIDRWKVTAETVKTQSDVRDIIVLDDVTGCTVDRVYAEIQRWKPDILCIDYISLMDINRSAGAAMWEKVTYITQALKQIARTSKVPIIGVAQTNINSAKEGAALDNIAYARSIGQDADTVLGLYSNDEMKADKQMEVRLLKNRDGMTTDTKLFWNMERMEFRQWKPGDTFVER